MTKPYRNSLLSPTTGAIDWEIETYDESTIRRLILNWDTAPTVDEYVTITLVSSEGASYNSVLFVVSPKHANTVKIDEIGSFLYGDVIKIEYANTEGNTITGIATYSL